MKTETEHYLIQHWSFQIIQTHTQPQNNYCDNHTTRQDRHILERQNKNTLDRHTLFFTPNLTAKAIKNAKTSQSTGPDGISSLHLKHFGPHVIRAVTKMFNHSLNNNSIGNTWKVGEIIPILKPNKLSNGPTSYRSIPLVRNPSKNLRGQFSTVLTPTSSSLLHNTVSSHTTLTAHCPRT